MPTFYPGDWAYRTTELKSNHSSVKDTLASMF